MSIYQNFNPPPPPPPTVLFGKLPPLSIPKIEAQQAANFTLELPEGELPTVDTTLPVFVIPKKAAYLGAIDDARNIVRELGFTDSEEEISPAIYRWHNNRFADSTISINIITGAFSLNSNLLEDSNLLGLRPPNEEAAAATIFSFLSGADLLTEDLENGTVSSSLIKKTADNQLVFAPSISEAQFIRVDLSRQDYNNLSVVTPVPKRSNVWFLISGSSDPPRQIIAGEFHYFPIDESQSSTYPIKTPQTAWEELKAGQGFIVNRAQKENVTIRRVYLAYYDSPEYQEFFQPVFVFEGDDGFASYVPAVTSEYYGE